MFLQFIHKDVKSCQNVIFLFMLIYQFTNGIARQKSATKKCVSTPVSKHMRTRSNIKPNTHSLQSYLPRIPKFSMSQLGKYGTNKHALQNPLTVKVRIDDFDAHYQNENDKAGLVGGISLHRKA